MNAFWVFGSGRLFAFFHPMGTTHESAAAMHAISRRILFYQPHPVSASVSLRCLGFFER